MSGVYAFPFLHLCPCRCDRPLDAFWSNSWTVGRRHFSLRKMSGGCQEKKYESFTSEILQVLFSLTVVFANWTQVQRQDQVQENSLLYDMQLSVLNVRYSIINTSLPILISCDALQEYRFRVTFLVIAAPWKHVDRTSSSTRPVKLMGDRRRSPSNRMKWKLVRLNT